MMKNMQSVVSTSVRSLEELLPRLEALAPQLESLGQMMLQCWENRGKVLTAGNGGSAADAMHFAEELVVRFQKNRRALAAIALCDPTVLTCAGNDYGYEQVFVRQVEALANPGDILLALSTSGNSPNILKAVTLAKAKGAKTVAWIGKDGGALRGQCDLEIHVPSNSTARVQEAHKILYHCLCEWIDARVE